MSALTNAELPTGFTTIEQLAIYISLTYATINPQLTYMINSNTAEKIADRAIVRTYDGRDYFLGRMAIPLDENYTTPTNPLWTYANEDSQVIVPARFKA